MTVDEIAKLPTGWTCHGTKYGESLLRSFAILTEVKSRLRAGIQSKQEILASISQMEREDVQIRFHCEVENIGRQK